MDEMQELRRTNLTLEAQNMRLRRYIRYIKRRLFRSLICWKDREARARFNLKTFLMSEKKTQSYVNSINEAVSMQRSIADLMEMVEKGLANCKETPCVKPPKPEGTAIVKPRCTVVFEVSVQVPGGD